MKLNTLEYSKMLVDNEITMTYVGPLWAEGIDGIAEMLKKRLDLEDLPLSISQAIFSVFVEQMNNMLMYSVETAPLIVFILGKHDGHFYLQTGNTMKTGSVKLLKSRLDHLNSLNKDELHEFFKEQRKQKDTNPESKGGGIGLIEIARRAYSKVEYEFTELDGEFTHFSMYVEI